MFTKIKDLTKLYPNPEHQEYRVLQMITEEDAQIYAKRIFGRKLTEDELYRVQKAIEQNDKDIWMILETSIREVALGGIDERTEYSYLGG
jgi:hypothetical protein